jgi:hypothetical protein
MSSVVMCIAGVIPLPVPNGIVGHHDKPELCELPRENLVLLRRFALAQPVAQHAEDSGQPPAAGTLGAIDVRGDRRLWTAVENDVLNDMIPKIMRAQDASVERSAFRQPCEADRLSKTGLDLLSPLRPGFRTQRQLKASHVFRSIVYRLAQWVRRGSYVEAIQFFKRTDDTQRTTVLCDGEDSPAPGRQGDNYQLWQSG